MTREEAIDFLKQEKFKNVNSKYRKDWNDASDMAIKELQDRPKGEWIKKQVFNPELDKYVPFIECSVCGYNPYYGGSEPKFNYCANCGADMRGGENE